MTRRRVLARPVVWILFAAMVAVPSVQLARLLRERGVMRPTRRVLGPAKGPIVAAAISRTGRLAALLDDSGEVTVWDVRARKRIRRIDSELELPIRSTWPFAAPMSIEDPPGLGLSQALLAIGGSDGRIRVWHVPSGKKLLTGAHSSDADADAENGSSRLVDAEISMEGGLFSVSGNGSLAQWRGGVPDDSALIWMTRSPGGRVVDVAFSADNQATAVAAADGVYLLTQRTRSWLPLDTRRTRAAEIDHSVLRGRPEEVRFSPGGGVLAASWVDGEVRVYSVTTRETLQAMRFGREGTPPRLLSFSPDGLLLAATDGRRAIQVWRIGAFGAPVALTAPHGTVRSMWFAPDGESLVVASDGDRYLRRLPLPATP